jgi:hypothetical protein
MDIERFGHGNTEQTTGNELHRFPLSLRITIVTRSLKEADL